MKNIKKTVCLIVGAAMLAALVGCNNFLDTGAKKVKKITENKMSENFVSTSELGIQPNDKNCSDKINKAISEGKSIYFETGIYYFDEPILLKNAQLIGTGPTGTCLVANTEKALVEADGCFAIKDLQLSSRCVDGKEKQGEKVLLQLGKHGGVTEGSVVSRVQFGDCGTGVYEAADAVATKGISVDTVEFSNISYAGFDFMSNGRKNNRISNAYIGRIGKGKNDFANVGARFAGKEENLALDQINVEHFRAETSLLFDGVKNLDVSSVHIEGMDIAKQGNGYVECNNTNGNLGNIVVYWSRVSYENSSCLLLGDAAKDGSELYIGELQFKGVNDPASFHGEWNNRGIKDNGYRIVDRKKDAKNEYRITVDNYVWFSYQNDRNTLAAFPCDEDNVTYLKKGNVRAFGTTEQRPTLCLCKGYTTYYDTTLNKLMIYNGTDWSEYTQAAVKSEIK